MVHSELVDRRTANRAVPLTICTKTAAMMNPESDALKAGCVATRVAEDPDLQIIQADGTAIDHL